MVVALEGVAAAAAVHQHRAAVAADVDERAQLALPVAGDEDRHAAGVGREVRARVGDLVGAAAVLPGAREDQRPLAAEHLLVAVPGEREREVGGCRGHHPMLAG